MHTNRCGSTCRQICCAKGRRKGAKIREFIHRCTTNAEDGMYDHTGNNWNQWNSNKVLKKNLETVPVKHSMDSLQNTAILGTSHIIRKVLQSETWTLSVGDHRCFREEVPGIKGLWQDITTTTWQETTNNNNNNNNNVIIIIVSTYSRRSTPQVFRAKLGLNTSSKNKFPNEYPNTHERI